MQMSARNPKSHSHGDYTVKNIYYDIVFYSAKIVHYSSSFTKQDLEIREELM